MNFMFHIGLICKTSKKTQSKTRWFFNRPSFNVHQIFLKKLSE
jgi:hypothetical protein